MILSCPDCGTRFAVDARAIGTDGRRVRCSRCAHVWFAEADPAELAAMADVLPPPGPAIHIEPRPIPPGSGLPALRGPQPPESSRMGWLVFALAVAVLVAAVLLGRESLVAAWPPAARLYAAIGLDAEPPGSGLELNVSPAERSVVNGVSTIVIQGVVRNASDSEQPVPPLRGAARGPDRTELYTWTFSTDVKQLRPGQSAPFSTRLDRPVAGAIDIAVTFAPDAASH